MQENKTISVVTSADSLISKPEPFTEAQLQTKVDYYIAQNMLEKMNEKGLISDMINII